MNLLAAVPSPTAAGTAAATTGGSALMTFLPIIVLFVLMYLILILPQRKKEKKMKAMLDAIQVGAEITTHGGIVGRVINIKEDDLTIETGVEKTKILIKRWAIRDVKEIEGA